MVALRSRMAPGGGGRTLEYTRDAGIRVAAAASGGAPDSAGWPTPRVHGDGAESETSRRLRIPWKSKGWLYMALVHERLPRRVVGRPIQAMMTSG